jgi:hypothetical protein
MSNASDLYEMAITNQVNLNEGFSAVWGTSVKLSDVYITSDTGESSWLEVKMNHSDNLSNPRFFYSSHGWSSTYKTEAAVTGVDILNESKEAAEFIKNVADFSGLSEHYGYNVSVGTNKSHLKWDNVIPLSVMKDYFDQDGINRYIAIKEDVNLGRVVTDHYLYGKDEPTYYMQAGDDFYMIGDDNPLDLPDDIPTLSGTGAYKVRVSTRSRFYEVQAEIKINNMPSSEYSLKPGSDKKNPLRRE